MATQSAAGPRHNLQADHVLCHTDMLLQHVSTPTMHSLGTDSVDLTATTAAVAIAQLHLSHGGYRSHQLLLWAKAALELQLWMTRCERLAYPKPAALPALSSSLVAAQLRQQQQQWQLHGQQQPTRQQLQAGPAEEMQLHGPVRVGWERRELLEWSGGSAWIG